MQPVVCTHRRVVVLARQDGVDYVECLDCRRILESDDVDTTEELTPVRAEDNED
jgi:hypothetical protein